MPSAAYVLVEAYLPGGFLHQAGRHSKRRILAYHPDLLSNSFSRGSFLVTATGGRHAEFTHCGATLPRVPRAVVNEDCHHA